MQQARTVGSTAGSFRCGRQLEIVAGHRLDPSACKNAASTPCSVLATSETAVVRRSRPALVTTRVPRRAPVELMATRPFWTQVQCARSIAVFVPPR
jgi:hypothetical protein